MSWMSGISSFVMLTLQKSKYEIVILLVWILQGLLRTHGYTDGEPMVEKRLDLDLRGKLNLQIDQGWNRRTHLLIG